MRNAMVNFMHALPQAVSRMWVSGPTDTRGVTEAPPDRWKRRTLKHLTRACYA